MADEYSRPPHNRRIAIEPGLGWQSLKGARGAALEVHYVTVLRELGNISVLFAPDIEAHQPFRHKNLPRM